MADSGLPLVATGLDWPPMEALLLGDGKARPGID